MDLPNLTPYMSAYTPGQCAGVSVSNTDLPVHAVVSPQIFRAHAYDWWGWREKEKSGPGWSGSDVAGCPGTPRRPHFLLSPVRALSGLSTRTYEEDLRSPVGNPLTRSTKVANRVNSSDLKQSPDSSYPKFREVCHCA